MAPPHLTRLLAVRNQRAGRRDRPADRQPDRMATLAAQLRAAVGEDRVLTDPAQLRTYECDGLAAIRATPGVVVLAETRDHVVDTVRLCAGAGVPFVARGSGTGLSGGALPVAD